ncbi:MAG: hypothetical protein H8Z69_05645 [Nanohaloarchaea archaeon]|nr:hypothetical protein [Candidatus Nanohaloarchaea archaeon]
MHTNKQRSRLLILVIMAILMASAVQSRTQLYSCSKIAGDSTYPDYPATTSCTYEIPSDGFYEVDAYVSGVGNLNTPFGTSLDVDGDRGDVGNYKPKQIFLESGDVLDLYITGFTPGGTSSGNLGVSSVSGSKSSTNGFSGATFSDSKSTDGTNTFCPSVDYEPPAETPRNIDINYTVPEDGVYSIKLTGNVDGSEDPAANYEGYVGGDAVISGSTSSSDVYKAKTIYENNVSLEKGQYVAIDGHAESYYEQVYSNGDYSCQSSKYSFVDISANVQQLSVPQPVKMIQNAEAPSGSLWVESSTLRWANGTHEFHTDGTTKVGSVSGTKGSLWVEGTALHWIDQNGDERKFKAEQVSTGSTVPKGTLWIESGTIHFIDQNGDERRLA